MHPALSRPWPPPCRQFFRSWGATARQIGEQLSAGDDQTRDIHHASRQACSTSTTVRSPQPGYRAQHSSQGHDSGQDEGDPVLSAQASCGIGGRLDGRRAIEASPAGHAGRGGRQALSDGHFSWRWTCVRRDGARRALPVRPRRQPRRGDPLFRARSRDSLPGFARCGRRRPDPFRPGEE